MNKIYSYLLGIKSAKFFGCCSTSIIPIERTYSFDILNGHYIFDHECFDWTGSGIGFGVGDVFGGGDGIGNSGDEPIDFERDKGNGHMSKYHELCVSISSVPQRELFCVERSFDD